MKGQLSIGSADKPSKSGGNASHSADVCGSGFIENKPFPNDSSRHIHDVVKTSRTDNDNVPVIGVKLVIIFTSRDIGDLSLSVGHETKIFFPLFNESR